jgi:hypothetical protein
MFFGKSEQAAATGGLFFHFWLRPSMYANIRDYSLAG